MSSESQTVWYNTRPSGGTHKVYHTDPECHAIDSLDNYRDTELVCLAGFRRECKFCAGEVSQPSDYTGRTQDTAPSHPDTYTTPETRRQNNVKIGTVWTGTRGFTDIDS